MMRAILVAVGAAIAALTIAACGSSGSSSSTSGGGAASSASTSTTKLVASTPAPTGDVSSVSWNIFNEPASVDPAKTNNYQESEVSSNLCDSLLQLDSNLQLKSALASKVTHPTPTSWVYTIRTGVKFWDGKPLTTADVVYSLQRNMNPRVASSWAYAYGDVKSISATGANQVTVQLTRPDVLFNRLMATGAGGISEQAYVESKGASYGSATGGLMCTGPYSLQKWTPGQSIVMRANPNYWDSSLAIHAKQVTFTFISDTNAEINALRSGTADGMFEVPTAGISTLRGAGSGSLIQGPSSVTTALTVHSKKGVLGNRLIRQALSLALDRAGINQTVFNGAGFPAKTMFGPGTWGYAQSTFQSWYDQLPSAAADLDKAKALVKQAGSPTGTINIATTPAPAWFSQMAQIIQQEAGQIGLKVKISVLPLNQYYPLFLDPTADPNVDAFITNFFVQTGEPLEFMEKTIPSNGADNYKIIDPSLESSYYKALGVANDQQRAKLVTQLATDYGNQYAWIPIVTLNEVSFGNNKITGWPTSITGYPNHPWAAGIGSKG